jgi:FimV-like protein
MQALLKLKDQQISALQSIVETRGLGAQGSAATPAPARQAAGTQAEGQPSTEGQPAAPARTSPVTLASDQLPQRRQPEVMDLFSSLPLWVWALSGGLLVLLLALILKRRMAEEQAPSDLPLASYPEVSRPAPKPYSEHAAVTAAEPEAPEVPGTPDLPEQAVSLHHGDIQAHDVSEEEHADMNALVEEIDLDLPYPADGELPELDENLVGTAEKGEKQGEEQDEIASFWDQLDIPEMQDPEEPGSGADESDQSLEILLEMARAYVELGDKDEAVGILEQALASSDDEERRARIQSVLDEIA